MMIAIPGVLDAHAVARCHDLLNGGDASAPLAAGDVILDAIGRSPAFMAAALPLKVFPPLFDTIAGGDMAGDERAAPRIDAAIRITPGSDFRVRADLSATIFLADPEQYDGGELMVEGHLGAHRIKLPAGDMLLYPASSLHHAIPVTRGERLCATFWIQSMIRDDGARTALYDLDGAIQDIAADRGPSDAAVVRLTGVYHNLLRRWAEV